LTLKGPRIVDAPASPTSPPGRWRHPPAAVVLAVGWLAGSIPFSNIAARVVRGVDLRNVGTGTVSGTSLYRVGGFGPLAVAGICEVAKGAVGPLLAGRDRPGLCAVASAAAVSGHNWSPFLAGAGGRGISPAIGSMLTAAPAGAAVLLGGLVAGRVGGETAIGCVIADAALVPVAARAHGRRGAMVAAAVLVPMIVKRVAGNRRPPAGSPLSVYVNRLLFDRDERDRSGAVVDR
jgi:glycerol-3-phosphate acyltransferase PlsY